ncbi:MAG: LPS export ABC transporter permease LptG [Gammaproteobacteria bacterium]|nr:LPS export ABC transporter permease LptG [Gammaproteobacteria bacterium]
MGLSATLSAYLARHIAFWLATVFAVVTGVALLFDTVELLRRSAGKDEIGMIVVLQMSVFKLPHLVQQMLPFCVLLGATLAFWRLARANELVVTRAAGISAWQVLAPATTIAILVGLVQISLFNPLASVMLSKFEQLETRYLKRSVSLLSVSSAGLWLRQSDATGQSVIHASRVAQSDMSLHEVIIFLFEGEDRFIGRIDAENARLREGYWEIQNAWISAPKKRPYYVARHRLDTDLTLNKILDSFASPETMSFWQLPGFIETLEKAGFSGHRHKLYWHSLLASPLLLAAMVLVAAIFSLRTSRHGGAALSICGAVLSGFFLYFMSDLVYALGLSASIPTLLAAWTPAGVSTLLGLTALFHIEDG